MEIKQYLDSTYLKTAAQAGISEEENREQALNCCREAIAEQFKLVMLRPEYVKEARKLIDDANSVLLLGTVIDFPEGNSAVADKLAQAQQAIADGADELDFVVDYRAFQQGDLEKVKTEVREGTQLCLENHRAAKWIIEVAALADDEIARLSAIVKNVVVTHFKQELFSRVFVKSSTGFFKTQDGKPNGATFPAVAIMLENACPLPVKAAGGVRNYEEAVAMVNLGVKRIGTSSAKAIADGHHGQFGY